MVPIISALVALVVASASAVAGWRALTGREDRRHSGLLDFSRLDRPRSRNDHLVAPDGATPRARPDRPAPVFAAPPERLRNAVEAVIRSEPRTRILARSRDGLRLKAVQRSRIMNFPDYIDLAILPVDGGSTVAIYSRAHYGWWDLGVNKARVRRWLAGVENRLPRGGSPAEVTRRRPDRADPAKG